MKKIFLFLTIILMISACEPVHASFFDNKKTQIIQNLETRKAKKDIKKVFIQQEKYASKYDLTSLSTLYHQDFESADGFKKDTYFDLIKETWKTYPDIVYNAKIQEIRINGNKAEIDVYETSVATTTEIAEDKAIFGELNSSSDGTYYLEKINDKWLFISEKVRNEKSFLKYGDTRFVEMDLISPKTAKAGEYYTATLKINKPEDAFIVASICKDKITYPQQKTEEVFRNLPNDNILERMFIANKDGKNEFNIATIGMSKSTQTGFGKIRIYMAGIAFIMTRVNIEDNNAEKNQ